jgi:glutamyl-tRNA reductase
LAELSLVGISHHGSSLEVRERVALDPDEASELARELAGDEGEAVCLSTCNRTELYVAGPGAEDRAAGALRMMNGRASESRDLSGDIASDVAVAGALYRRADDEAARHLFRVAAGLDSRVRGETEILGQVRAAYALGTPGPLLDRLFREALRVGRKVRA